MQKIKVKAFIIDGKINGFLLSLNGVQHITHDFYQYASLKEQFDLRTSRTTQVDGDTHNQHIVEDLTRFSNEPGSALIDTEAELTYNEAKDWGISTCSIIFPPRTFD